MEEPWQIITTIWRLSRHLREEATPCLEQIGLGRFDPWMLEAVDQWAYPSKLAEITLLPAPTISQYLRRLEKAGLVVRTFDPQDLRRFRFEVTPHGRQLQQLGRQCITRVLQTRLDHLSHEQQTQLLHLLGQLAPLPE